ncbi:vWA domain-containing protein [Sulfurimonas microaerophilic]|uniref:vWA domain-containing protein n=1 Tax=Sulfurimonas microaerophilic TaxID=3058392 RepID=UPI00271491BD|nr:VWA-like domain-containing protein [Sulfurimonas sp. hsl 1-7]
MSAEELLTKAKSQLINKHPYFGMLASRLKHEQSEKVDHYASNGVRFLYNAAFVEECSIEELQFILTNAVMHHVLAHKQRKLRRRGALWQLATDYAINNMLVKNKFKLPKGVNYDKAFKNMYAEEIYEELKNQLIADGVSLYDDADILDEITAGKNEFSFFSRIKRIEKNPSEKDEDEWDYAATLAKEVAQKKSLMPSGFERFAKKMVANDIDWRFELYNAINRHMRNNYAFMPPNKKHLYRGVALPSLASDTLSLIVAIDTSGSINESLLGVFKSEFESIMQNFPSIRIELLIVDAKVHHHYTFVGAEELDFKLTGGGGTDYRVVFDYVEQNLPMSTMLLYFTDGEGIFPRIPPSYEVLWALSQNKNKIPFGRKLLILG